MPEDPALAPSEEEMDVLLDPQNLSGAQIDVLKKMDDKNVDHADIKILVTTFIEAFNRARND